MDHHPTSTKGRRACENSRLFSKVTVFFTEQERSFRLKGLGDMNFLWSFQNCPFPNGNIQVLTLHSSIKLSPVNEELFLLEQVFIGVQDIDPLGWIGSR